MRDHDKPEQEPTAEVKLNLPIGIYYVTRGALGGIVNHIKVESITTLKVTVS